jgi:hypothetical protein
MDNEEREGRVARDLFRTDSDTEEEDDVEGEMSEEEEQPSDVVQRQIGNVVIEERQAGATIAQRLWPAASYLTDYIDDLLSRTAGDNSDRLELREDSLRDSELEKRIQAQFADSTEHLSVLEVGAGIGLTGIDLATRFPAHVLLTDLQEALPLADRNIQLNCERFQVGPQAVQSRVLRWGDTGDGESMLREWYQQLPTLDSESPLLILGSDVVYFEELYKILEETLFHLLSQTPAVVLLAGMRRWKRDTAFYQNLGKHSKTPTQQLSCTLLREQVGRTEAGEREIFRIYAVELVEKGKY